MCANFDKFEKVLGELWKKRRNNKVRTSVPQPKSCKQIFEIF